MFDESEREPPEADPLKLAEQIAEMVPDGTSLHREIVLLLPRGRYIASRLPGSSCGSWIVARELARGERDGACPRGTCQTLLSELQKAEVSR